MWGRRAFREGLKKELPNWIAAGWVSPENGDQLLARYDTRADQASLVTAAFAILGVLLLLSGVITFFAANWDEMSKLAKLVILFGALGGSYALAVKPFDAERHPRLHQAMLLLGAGLFGANIMLIAQIYHIDSHYPNGVLSWSLGALLVAWLMRAQAVMVFAIALAVLWHGMESLDFDQYNVLFLGWLALATPRIAQVRWRFSAHLVALAVIFWTVLACFEAVDYDHKIPVLFITEIVFLGYLALFVLGLLMHYVPRAKDWAPIVQRYSALVALYAFYLLTSPKLLHNQRWWGIVESIEFSSAETGVLAALSALVIVLAIIHHRIATREGQPAYIGWARWLLGACFVLLAVTWFSDGSYGGYIAIAFNLYYFAGLAWLVAAGVHLNDRALVNFAFLFFALALITRYFDTFWSLMNRSFFFMAGGVLLIGIGYVLERQRRKFTGGIVDRRAAEGTA